MIKMANSIEINTGKAIDGFLRKYSSGHLDKIIRDAVCIKPTATLTKDKCYDVILRKNAYHPSTKRRDGIEIDKCGVINDRGLFVEVQANRFNIK